MTDAAILEFDGEYRWLSNFYDHIIDLGGVMFSSAEHGYQAAKTLDPVWQKDIRLARSPGMARRLGREAPLRPDWEDVKNEVMRLVVAAKFPVAGALSQRLLDTGERTLVEGNHWHDRYWGACWVSGQTVTPKGQARWWLDEVSRALDGANHLGLLLMERRQQLREEVSA